MLQHLYRWLSTTSKLYDPLLHRMVHRMMSKNFMILVNRINRLHCKVVYASFSKLIVQTQHNDFESASNFVDSQGDTGII